MRQILDVLPGALLPDEAGRHLPASVQAQFGHGRLEGGGADAAVAEAGGTADAGDAPVSERRQVAHRLRGRRGVVRAGDATGRGARRA